MSEMKDVQLIIPDFGETDTLNMKQRLHAARVLADDINDLIADLPVAAFNFGQSVGEKVESIMSSIYEVHRVTENQMRAMENMKAGLEKWFRD